MPQHVLVVSVNLMDAETAYYVLPLDAFRDLKERHGIDEDALCAASWRDVLRLASSKGSRAGSDIKAFVRRVPQLAVASRCDCDCQPFDLAPYAIAKCVTTFVVFE